MSELRDLLSVPAEQDLPAGRLELRKAELLRAVEADLQAAEKTVTRSRLLRSLRAWLISLLILVAFGTGLASSWSKAGLTRQPTTALVGVVAAASAAPALASLAASPRAGRDGTPVSRQAFTRARGSANAVLMEAIV
jgi:hypothetical protein